MNISRLILHSLPLNHFTTYPENISSVMLPDVNEAAVKNIFPERLSVVLVGKKESIMEQFKDSGLGPIKELDFEGNQVS